MDLTLWKKVKKEQNLTIEEISKRANLPKGSVQNIFCGYVPNPRTDTVQAIEKALGIEREMQELISEEEKELIELIKQLDEEQVKELSSYIDYLISKRK